VRDSIIFRNSTPDSQEKKCGKGFKYISHDGSIITCKETRRRLKELVIPPAWKDVWICTDPDGHIQATGYDDAGRKQYIYHARWHEASAAYKYGRLQLFAGLLPRIRRQVRKDLQETNLTKRRVIAAVVRLLDKASIRIGNKRYVQENESHGATTLMTEHVECNSDKVSLNFKGKSGKQIELECRDSGLAAVIADCENNESEFLFSYQTDENEAVAVTSADVNAYLLEIAKESITAKDFRTWRGSVIALAQLSTMEEVLSKTARKRMIVDAVRAAATALGNTLAVCRQSYIHSAILAHAERGSLPRLLQAVEHKVTRSMGMTKDELRLSILLPHLDDANSLLNYKRKRARLQKRLSA
jgi:DNA topoisomerase-1